jgi:hypothetical protein
LLLFIVSVVADLSALLPCHRHIVTPEAISKVSLGLQQRFLAWLLPKSCLHTLPRMLRTCLVRSSLKIHCFASKPIFEIASNKGAHEWATTESTECILQGP